jgi:hypothetical protein
MSKRFIAPALADLSQDIAGVIPVDLIQNWAETPKDLVAQKKLLAPHTKIGTVVSSDSAGLSKLASQKTLLEVMKLVSEPKEIIFSYGKHIGGEAVGIWAADNTQMFYGEGIDPSSIIHQMVLAQKEIEALAVKVGLCAHHGEFILLGGGIFGHDAELVEEIAENHTSGGEILVTNLLKQKLSSEIIKNLTQSAHEHALKINYSGLSILGEKSKDYMYPTPFTVDFFEAVRNIDLSDSSQLEKMYQKYSFDKIVVLTKVNHTPRTLLLDSLTDWTLANAITTNLAKTYGIEMIKSNGSLGIYVTESIEQAVEFSLDLRIAMRDNGYIVTTGISKGEVLIFPLENGDKEIAGNPVNVASKVAEDAGEQGCIFIESSADSMESDGNVEEFEISISGVSIKGKKI